MSQKSAQQQTRTPDLYRNQEETHRQIISIRGLTDTVIHIYKVRK